MPRLRRQRRTSGLAANQIARRLPATVIGQASRSQAVVRVASGGDPPETCPEGQTLAAPDSVVRQAFTSGARTLDNVGGRIRGRWQGDADARVLAGGSVVSGPGHHGRRHAAGGGSGGARRDRPGRGRRPAPADRRRWTYTELLEQSEQAARALLGRFEPGERVAVWANNIPEWVMLEFAAALAGITIVTVNPALRAQELTHVLGQSRANGIFLIPEYRGARLDLTA